MNVMNSAELGSVEWCGTVSIRLEPEHGRNGEVAIWGHEIHMPRHGGGLSSSAAINAVDDTLQSVVVLQKMDANFARSAEIQCR
jgi:hypothetical protein